MVLLLRNLPAASWFVLGIDAGATDRSPSLARLRSLLARELGTTVPLSELGGPDLLLGATHVAYAVTESGDIDDDFIVSVATPAAASVRDRAISLGANANEGAVSWLALPRGEALVLEAGPPARLTLARPNCVAALFGALGGAALMTGELGPVLAPIVDAPVFAAMRLRPEQKSDLESMVAGLGAARSVGASVRLSADPTLPLSLSARLDLGFGDTTAATTALANLERVRVEAASSPERALLGRVVPTVRDTTLSLELTLGEPELALLLSGAHLDD
jgi:hypothetical protein